MFAIELLLLIIAYTLMIVTIFLEFVCYKRNLETPETIAFTLSLLVLIVAFTVAPLLEAGNPAPNTHVFILLAMILTALTTPLNVLEERQHRIPALWKKLFSALSALLFIATLVFYFLNKLEFFQYVVMSFLAVSVILSMILIRTTKPQKRIAHREKTERIFSLAFIILLPLSFFLNSVFEKEYAELKIGFTIPLVFILLTASKLLDDLQRLSLFNPKAEPNQQHFKNYALTDRESEIALLLAKGKSYKDIADALFISLPTVKTHASNIYRKCGVKSKFELIALLIN